MADVSDLLAVFDAQTVRRLAPERVIRRGEKYQRAGAVTVTGLSPTEVIADVDGTRRYEVGLDVSGHGDWWCTCPAAEGGDFCKHCVALALEVAAIDAGEAEPPVALAVHRSGAAADERQRLVDHLEQLSHERLVELLVHQVDVDWSLRERLLLAIDAANDTVDLAHWKRRIDGAVSVGGYVDWRQAPTWANGVYLVLDALDALSADGHADAVIALAEHACRSVEAVVGYVDDSEDGCLYDISERIADLHLQACQANPPDPVGLARVLVDLELGSEFGTFGSAAEIYADLLGDVGLAEYGRLLDSLGTGGTQSDRHWTLKSMRRAYVAALDDVDAFVAELSRDPAPGDVEAIMRALADAGRLDDAIDAGRAGRDRLRSDSSRSTPGVTAALAALLVERGDHDAAVALFRDDFETAPSVSTLERLLAAVGPGADTTLADSIEYVRKRVAARPSRTPGVANATLIEILVWAGRHDEAWEAARTRGCLPRQMLELARHREASHPLDAIEVYEPEIISAIETTSNAGYEQAVALMVRVERLAEAAEVPERFEAIVDIARTTHKRKRNLQRLLDRQGWWPLSR